MFGSGGVTSKLSCDWLVGKTVDLLCDASVENVHCAHYPHEVIFFSSDEPTSKKDKRNKKKKKRKGRKGGRSSEEETVPRPSVDTTTGEMPEVCVCVLYSTVPTNPSVDQFQYDMQGILDTGSDLYRGWFGSGTEAMCCRIIFRIGPLGKLPLPKHLDHILVNEWV